MVDLSVNVKESLATNEFVSFPSLARTTPTQTFKTTEPSLEDLLGDVKPLHHFFFFDGNNIPSY